MATIVTSQPANSETMTAIPRRHFADNEVSLSNGGRAATAARVVGIRVALYSHDTMGLGHLRRNLLIADKLAGPPLCASSLLITGAHEANFFRLPDRADCLTLPRMHKNLAGDYAAGHLELSLEVLAQLRGRSICSALEIFEPDLLIVDKVPTGAFNELLPALRMLASRGRTKCVLGLRDVLDDPAIVAREWLIPANKLAIERFYDSIWVYGDAQVYDPIVEYALPAAISKRITFTGYMDQSARLCTANTESKRLIDGFAADGRLIACLVGGGQDGALIARTFIRAFPMSGATGVVVTGPFMPEADRKALVAQASANPNLHVLDFVPEADLLIERSERVVAMAGYNTVCSLLSFGKKALLVPRVTPRAEQQIRAERLERLGFVDVMLPHELSISSLHSWLTEDAKQPADRHGSIDFGGLARLHSLTYDVLGSKPRSHQS